MTVKKSGKNINIFACIGSGGVGFNFCCINMLTPMSIGHAPINKNDGGSQGIKPNKLKIEVVLSEIDNSTLAETNFSKIEDSIELKKADSEYIKLFEIFTEKYKQDSGDVDNSFQEGILSL